MTTNTDRIGKIIGFSMNNSI